MALIIGWLEENAGLTTDTSSSTGSLHAKLEYLRQDVVGDSADVRADNTVMGWLASPIKSIQRGTKSVTSSGDTQSISSVTTGKSMLVLTGMTFNGSTTSDPNESAEQINVQAVLTNATTITFTVTDDTETSVVSWQVIEYY